ncbi:MAG TPA: SAM-dependent chlorinase/fluorinase, partial [Dehalococcoidia bacterium]|nr:SAM-dependent chlorinase/fluorinase [Dehalococcoidia bacterium]
MASPPITLLTDFGLTDAYVGIMKGVILSLNPFAPIVDITHEVAPQAVQQGAFLLSLAHPHFPAGSIHVAVVDPGVGSDRKALVLETESGIFVGPDNGVLSAALPESCRFSADEAGSRVSIPPEVRAIALTKQNYFRQPVSSTFHGRDIFAPVAAHLSLGVSPREMGEPVESIVAFPPFRALKREDGSLEGRVLHVDRFGNLITSVRARDLPSSAVTVTVAGHSIPGLMPNYAEAGPGLCSLIGSEGYLEISLPGG